MVDQNSGKDQFLYTYSKYRGKFKPENLVFNANLQEFAQKVSYICNLETNGKLSSAQAYKEIKHIWKQLKESIQNLDIEEENPHQSSE